MVKLQDVFECNGVFQGGLVQVGGYAFHKIRLLGVDAANDNIGIADINGKNHKISVLSGGRAAINISRSGHGAIIAWIDGRRKDEGE